MSYQVIIFDLGDTLIRQSPDHAAILITILDKIGLSLPDDAEDNVRLAMQTASYEQIAKEENGAPRMDESDFDLLLTKAALICIFHELNDKLLMKCVELQNVKNDQDVKLEVIPGVFPILDELKKRDYKLAVLSNHRAWMPDYLVSVGLANYFEQIIISDLVGYEKPDVRIMESALKLLNELPENCLYVGDHPFDVLCAKKARIDCVWIASEHSVLPPSIRYKETYMIQKLEDLLNIL
jgi:HAD superfamily hydrolase (TIGR01509 family)